MSTTSSETITLIRHFETSKNEAGIHGHSDLDALTEAGVRQAESLVSRLATFNLEPAGVLATPTPQAEVSAIRLARMLGIPYEGTLALDPIDLGAASGLTNEEFRASDPDGYQSLDLFRARVMDIQEVTIDGVENPLALERRIKSWWQTEGKHRCPGRVVVGSNSTVLMVSHLLDRSLPSTGNYLCYGIPNGAMRAWTKGGDSWRCVTQSVEVNTMTSRVVGWPEVEQEGVETGAGSVALSRHVSGWERRRTSMVVVPGYFGSSRHGPYGLYTRLARTWSFNGFETRTIDPLGTGDSSNVDRSFDTEVRSIKAALREAGERSEHIVIVAHSMAVAAALRARSTMEAGPPVSVWSLAPLCSFDDVRLGFLSPEQYEELVGQGRVLRHGLELRLDFVRAADSAWRELSASVDAVWTGSEDRYTAGQDLSALTLAQRFVVSGADHNFSGAGAIDVLASQTVALALEVDGRS